MRKTLIIGATSAIAQATGRLFAAAGDALYLVARDEAKLGIIADDLAVRGASSVHVAVLDVRDYARHEVVINSAITMLEGLDLVLIAHGTLPDQKACEQSVELTRREFEVNAMSTVSLLTHLANYFEAKQQGQIVVISSVAGDRGRQSNYVYGAAKATLSVFLQGLRNRLYKSGVQVLTVKPGFVDTPMTAEFPKGPLWATPHAVARRIVRSLDRRGNVVYAPLWWWAVMTAIKHVPESLFKRLNL